MLFYIEYRILSKIPKFLSKSQYVKKYYYFQQYIHNLRINYYQNIFKFKI